jgi:hypothetical protein
MRTFLPAFLSLCFAVGIVAFAQDPPNPAPQRHQAAATQLTSMMGTVRADGEKLPFVTDQRGRGAHLCVRCKGRERMCSSRSGYSSAPSEITADAT